MIVCRRDTVSASTLAQSGFKNSLDLSFQRLERELLRSRSTGNFLRVLALALGEQLAHHPRARARVAKPVDVETRGELLVQDGLQLPGSQIARGIVSRSAVHTGSGLVVVVARGAGDNRK